MAHNKSIPQFGQKIAGKLYHIRPGAYAIIFSVQDLVALIQVGQNHFLPGGGIETGETPQEALKREMAEECGYELLVGAVLGTAVEYIYVRSEAKYYEIHSSFWQASLGEKIEEPNELDHQLVWHDATKAFTLLSREGQRWALQIACESS